MDEHWNTLLRAFSCCCANLIGTLGWGSPVGMWRFLKIALNPLFSVWQSPGQLSAQEEQTEVLSDSLG